ncbi:TolB family protein [Streptomyces zagrosensis]|uniref:Tol biopolymer transport system component n=1 Tax=Streptomyces zagrosensis TaxID=1042984 RepID=A0A7W9Q898_9ACTN|nr:hypothetical protein [Streptomyces zagrosensis]MBB5935449.1 Tol biopolymer transport system component [Streptomyces zagrosensis]
MRLLRLATALPAVGLCLLTLPASPAHGSTETSHQPPAASSPAGPPPLIERVSVTADGQQANGASWGGILSGDGHTVVFVSEASNLLPGATPGIQIYAKDLRTEKVEVVSVGTDGQLASGLGGRQAVSANGRFVVFDAQSALDASDTNEGADVYLRDRWKGTTELLTTKGTKAPDGRSFGASISTDGRYVSFTSLRSDFGPKDTNGTGDVYVRDRQRGTTELVSVATDGTQGDAPSSESLLSPDGRQATFTTTAKTLFPWTRPQQAVKRPVPYVTFGVHDRRTEQTTAGAYNHNGLPAKVSYELAFSADSRYLLFQSGERIVPEGEPTGAWNYYARDLRTGSYRRLVLMPDGSVPQRTVYGQGLSPDNRTVYFTCSDLGLSPGDTNAEWHIYGRDLVTGKIARITSTPEGHAPAGGSWGASPDRSGRSLLFTSDAPDLVAGDTNGAQDVFVRRLR